MIAHRVDPLGEAAWRAFHSLEPNQINLGTFADCSRDHQQAWSDAARAAVLHWFENEFREAVTDPDRVRLATDVIKAGRDKGDPAVTILGVTIASFVGGLVYGDGFPPEGTES